MRGALPAAGLLLVGLAACGSPSHSTRGVEVAAGSRHACARMDDGTVRCWGAWNAGQRGQGVLLGAGPWKLVGRDSLVPRTLVEQQQRAGQVVNLDAVEQLAAGSDHTCARRKSAAVWCWGANELGQLGAPQDKRASIPYPVRVGALPAATQLAAGSHHTCARVADATVWCWGDDAAGQVGHEGRAPAAVAGIADAAAVHAAGDTSCAVLGNGTVRCWGDNRAGQIGDGTAGDPKRAPTAVQGVRDAVQVAVAPSHVCALTKAGEVLCWGGNQAGQLGEQAGPAAPSHPQPVAQPRFARAVRLVVSTGVTCAALSDGKMWCAGAGQPSVWELPAVGAASSVALTEPWSWQGSLAGRPSGCAALDNGALMGWGELTPRSDGAPASDNPVQVRW
jgi:alpha-tubulin suppressor-like RCC1 family protein